MNTNKPSALLHRPRKNQKKHTDGTSPSPSLPSSLLHGILFALLLSPLFVLSLSLAAYFTEDPVRLIPVCGILCAYLFAFCAGAFAARHHKNRFLFCGLLVALIQTAALFLLSLAFGGSGHSYALPVTLLLYAGLFPIAVMGAYLGIPKANGNKKRGKHPVKRR